LLYRAGFKLPNPIEFESNMSVEINITKRNRIIINPATGEVIPRITKGLDVSREKDASQEQDESQKAK